LFVCLYQAIPEACDPVKRREQLKKRRDHIRAVQVARKRKEEEERQQQQLLLLQQQKEQQQQAASLSLTSITNIVNTATTSSSIRSIPNLNETMTMPFDMDLSYTTASIRENNINNDSISKSFGRNESQGITKTDTIDSDTTGSRIDVDDDIDTMNSISNNQEQDTAQNQHHIPSSEFMAKIKTNQIPCPRICGATFSPGVGGLTGTYFKCIRVFEMKLHLIVYQNI
jgi:hypothetical protein